MSPIEELVQLARDAESKIGVTYNSPDVLPFTTKALAIIRRHPELQTDFEREFVNMVSYAPSEFVEVCMHVLRWPRVKAEFESRSRAAVERNDWRLEPVYRHYLEAFEPDWEDAKDFYAAYFGLSNEA